MSVAWLIAWPGSASAALGGSLLMCPRHVYSQAQGRLVCDSYYSEG